MDWMTYFVVSSKGVLVTHIVGYHSLQSVYKWYISHILDTLGHVFVCSSSYIYLLHNTVHPIDINYIYLYTCISIYSYTVI